MKAKPGRFGKNLELRQLKGAETIEIFHGDMADKETKVEIYGPPR